MSSNQTTIDEISTGRPPGSSNKKPVLKVADVTLEVNLNGLSATRLKYGSAFTPKLACRIIDHLLKIVGPDAVIPDDLTEFAAKKRPGRKINGPMTPPKEGEWRPYTVSQQGRIGSPVEILGARTGQVVWTRFTSKRLITQTTPPTKEQLEGAE